MDQSVNTGASFNLREQVEALLPSWESWYPTLFEAACDLGILRARVCDLSSLVLSNRHASIYNEAVQAFRNQWQADEPEAIDTPVSNARTHGNGRTAALPRKERDLDNDATALLAAFGYEDALHDLPGDDPSQDDDLAADIDRSADDDIRP